MADFRLNRRRLRSDVGEAGALIIAFIMCGALGWLCGMALALEQLR